MALPGLKFLLDTAVDTVLNHEVIDEVLKSVLNVVRKKNFYLDSLEINKDDHHNEQNIWNNLRILITYVVTHVAL